MSETEKLCPMHGIDCFARTRRQIEADAASIWALLKETAGCEEPHPSGAFEAIKRLEVAALELVQLSEDIQLAKRCPCKTCELFRLATPSIQ